MTYKELTEGIIKLWKKDARLMDVDDLTREYFRAVQQRAGGNRKWLESEVTWTVEDLTREAYTAMQREENDNSQRERTDLLCLVIINLIGYLEEFGIISWTRMALWLQNIGELKDRGTAYFLGLDAVAEQEAQLRKKGLLPPSSLPRRSLNLERDSRGIKSEETIVADLMGLLGLDKNNEKESRMMRCFLFGGDDDGGMIRLPYVNRLAFLLRELREMKPKGFPHNAYKLAEAWFLNSKGYKIKIKSLKVLASQFRDAETEGKIRTLLQANISKA